MKRIYAVLFLLSLSAFYSCEQVNPPANGAVSTDVQVTDGDPYGNNNDNNDNDDN
ncbi:hypothetical protein [Roseivirga sp.]|uniref:hypothetical protein n=1 Tax=Roseivirga sp. TaxID=1964215 RepID=UPI003B8C42B0